MTIPTSTLSGRFSSQSFVDELGSRSENDDSEVVSNQPEPFVSVVLLELSLGTVDVVDVEVTAVEGVSTVVEVERTLVEVALGAAPLSGETHPEGGDEGPV